MGVDRNARLTPLRRVQMIRAVVDHGLSKAEAARCFETRAKIVASCEAVEILQRQLHPRRHGRTNLR